MGNVLKSAAICLVLVAAAVSMSAQSKGLLTVDAIYHPEQRVAFSGFAEDDISWLDPATYVVARQSGSGFDWLKVDAASGRTSPLFDPARMETALATQPGVTRAEAGLIARSNDLIFNATRTGILVTIADDLYFYDIAGTRASRLTTAMGTEEVATFSPDGKSVAFVRGNNLYVVDVATQRERPLTTDGGREIFNGKLDWLYQEEIYGRDQFRGYWWSPDSARIAFLQLDERPVPEYTVVDHIPYRPSLESHRLSQSRRSKSAGQARDLERDGRRSGVDRRLHVCNLRVPDRGRGLDSGFAARRVSESRIASRPGSI
jgi:dipeptidyl-peptidase-4